MGDHAIFDVLFFILCNNIMYLNMSGFGNLVPERYYWLFYTNSVHWGINPPSKTSPPLFFVQPL